VKKHRLRLEELSAYLDGEARDPAAVERQLREDPEAAQHYRALTTLSTHLRRLPPPNVHPAFAARVIAAVSSRRPLAANQSRTVRLVMALGAPLVALALIAVTASVLRRTAPSSTTDLPVAEVLHPQAEDPEEVYDGLLDQLLYTDFEEALQWFDESPEAVAAEEDLVEILPSEEWLNSALAALDAESDLDDVVESLDPEEKEILETLLNEYAQKERLS
jgi:hypothetical protein